MDNNNLSKLKQLYENGFKCIRYEDSDNGELRAYFKNFTEERIDEIVSEDKKEITEIKNYIDNN